MATTVQRRARGRRVQLVLHAGASPRRYRELGAFVRYCIARIERELGEGARWMVEVVPARGGFASTVVVRERAFELQATEVGGDGTLAIWEAMCRLEQGLREARARRS